MGKKSKKKGNNRRKQSKDARVAQSAARRLPTDEALSLMTGGAFRDRLTAVGGPGAVKEVVGEDVPIERRMRRVEVLHRHGAGWDETIGKILALNASEDYAGAIAMATDLLEDIDAKAGPSLQTSSAIMEGKDMTCFEHMLVPQRILATYLRLEAHCNLANHDAALKDANDGLALCQLPIQHGHMGPWIQVRFLIRRAETFDGMGDLDSCVIDYRASCAAVRAAGDKWTDEELANGATRNALAAIVRQKMKTEVDKDGSRSGRPHFTKAERSKLEKEFGINAFSEENFRCGSCGTTEALLRCDGCDAAWFCSKECHLMAWKMGHKEACRKATRDGRMMRVNGMMHILIAAAVSNSEHNVFVDLHGRLIKSNAARDETLIYLLDDERIFECLSGTEVSVMNVDESIENLKELLLERKERGELSGIEADEEIKNIEALTQKQGEKAL